MEWCLECYFHEKRYKLLREIYLTQSNVCRTEEYSHYKGITIHLGKYETRYLITSTASKTSTVETADLQGNDTKDGGKDRLWIRTTAIYEVTCTDLI